MGMYAMDPEDYDTFKPYMDKVIRAYHKIPGQVQHKTNWDLSTKGSKLPPGGQCVPPNPNLCKPVSLT
jgi:hypothetical protein